MEIDLNEDIVQTDSLDAPPSDFNSIIGCIEDIVVSVNFQVGYEGKVTNITLICIYTLHSKELQTNFLDKNCMLFTNEEENKIYYMEIFDEYTKLIENFIFDNLKIAMPNIDFDSFIMELK